VTAVRTEGVITNERALFVAVSEYIAPLKSVAYSVPAHRDWVAKLYRSGVMLASGPQDPPIGGVLIFQAPDREAANRLIALDPLVLDGVATYEVRAFHPTPPPWRSAAIESFLGGEPSTAPQEPI